MMLSMNKRLVGCSTLRAGRRTYDHRLREAVCAAGDPRLFESCLSIPPPAVRSWLQRGVPQVVSLDEGDFEVAELGLEIARLQRRIGKYRQATRKLASVVRRKRAELDVTGISLASQRVPKASAKARLLAAVARAQGVLRLVIILKLLSLSSARYHAWVRSQKECGLKDRSSCPKTSPTQLTAAELATMKEMVTSKEYRHMPITTLARFAQRTRRVFASVSTWSKKVRERGWRRPRNRVYPAKPKVGIRATKPNEYWHIDVTVIRLLDGTKVFLHGVIDNFSRRILAWRICERLSPTTTVAVLREAAAGVGIKPTLVADSGVENINGEVDELVSDGVVNRVLALVEVSYSNSIVEAYWRSLKHQWLFLNELDNVRALEKLVAFHVEQHNSVMPHSAFRGQTPDEMYFDTGAKVADELAVARAEARRKRLAVNRALSCSTCEPETRVNTAALQLRQRES
jgi:putative transposase